MSTTRRVFLRSAALGVFALPSWAVSARSDSLDDHGHGHGSGQRQFDRIFYDVRRPEALDFGETARQAGARTMAISGDVEDPCYEDLRRRWRCARSPVAGITDFRVLSLLQMMAADVGMRPVLRIHHIGHGAAWVHETFGSSATLAASRVQLTRAGTHWSKSAARLVMNFAAVDRTELDGAADMSRVKVRAFDSRALVTWAIA